MERASLTNEMNQISGSPLTDWMTAVERGLDEALMWLSMNRRMRILLEEVFELFEMIKVQDCVDCDTIEARYLEAG